MSLFIYFLFEMRVISHQHFYLAEKGGDLKIVHEGQRGGKDGFLSQNWRFFCTI